MRQVSRGGCRGSGGPGEGGAYPIRESRRDRSGDHRGYLQSMWHEVFGGEGDQEGQ